MKKIFGLCLLLTLAGCNQAPSSEESQDYPPQDTTVYKEQLETDPQLQGYLSYELGELIQNLMLDKDGQYFNWDHLANDSKILWLTNGYQENYDASNASYRSTREGLIRVHLLGERVSELKDRKYEVPWQITYIGTQAKFGVDQIDLQPKGDFMSFGDPLPSLKKAGVKFTEVCQRQQFGEAIKAYKLTARGKTEVYMMDITSSGSAGSSQWLTLSLNDISADWCKEL